MTPQRQDGENPPVSEPSTTAPADPDPDTSTSIDDGGASPAPEPEQSVPTTEQAPPAEQPTVETTTEPGAGHLSLGVAEGVTDLEGTLRSPVPPS